MSAHTQPTGHPLHDDRPIPYTLTPKAHAALDRAPLPGHPVKDGAGNDCTCGDCLAGAGEWACQRCGLAFFGAVPEHGLCAVCLASEGAQ